MSICSYCQSTHCSSAYSTYDQQDRQWAISRCHICLSFFLDPPPTSQDLQLAYRDSYYGGGEEKFNGIIGRAVRYFSESRVRHVQRLIKTPAKVLDIGCGSGAFLKSLAKLGYQVFGTELEGKAAERARTVEEINLHIGNLNTETFPGEYFDFISLWHVFEHLSKPKEMLETISPLLNSGGYLALSLPNIESLQAKVFKAHWFHWDPPRHIFLPNPRKLIDDIQSLDMSLVRQQHLSLEQGPYGFQQSLLNALTKDRDRLYEHFKGNKLAYGESSQSRQRAEHIYFFLSLPLATTASLLEAILGKGGCMQYIFRKN